MSKINSDEDFDEGVTEEQILNSRFSYKLICLFK